MNLNHIHIQLTPIDQIGDLLSIRATELKDNGVREMTNFRQNFKTTPKTHT